MSLAFANQPTAPVDEKFSGPQMRPTSPRRPQSSSLIKTFVDSHPDLQLWVTSDLDDLAHVWPSSDKLGGAQCYVFQYADFLKVWCDTIGAARKTETLFIAVLNLAGQPVLLLPLGVERSAGVRVLAFLDGGVSDYNAPVLFAGAATWTRTTAKAFWASLCRVIPKFDVAVLEKMPERVAEISNPLRFLVTSANPDSGHAMQLAPCSHQRAPVRLPRAQDTRRKLRKLGELGTIEFKIAQTREDREALLTAMMRQKTRRYIETRGADGFDRPGYRQFFRSATERLARNGTLHLSALTLNGEILASHWGYTAGGRFYYIMPGYEGGEWSRYSVGRVLLKNLVEWSVANGISIFDYGPGDETYKGEYCDVRLPLSQIELAITTRGHAFLNFRALRRQIGASPLRGPLQAVRRGARLLTRTMNPKHWVGGTLGWAFSVDRSMTVELCELGTMGL